MSALQVFIKAPTGKITLDLESDSITVAELKALIHSKDETLPADQQRLIYSGRILKDEDLVSKYALKTGHTIHLVKSAPPADPVPAAATVPSTFAAGQQIAGNPLAPLLNAQNAGAFANFNPFADMGINPNDPNYLQNMMNNPTVQANVRNLLQDPAVVDQIIASNPELSAMAPQFRQMMQSEQFRNFLTDPQAMRQMQEMMGGMRGAGGMGGMGAGGQTPASLYNPWAPSTGTGAGATPTIPGGNTPFVNPFQANPGDFNQMLTQAQGLASSLAGVNVGGPQVSPEERYATQLEQLAGMGFTDAAKNVRALLASGGNVEGAVEWLFSN